jgi:pimeloyl-ACP methyl ester carboxylesterase
VELDFRLSSGRVSARRWGDPSAPLVLCVHGLSANLTAYSWLAEGIVRTGRQVVAFDCRGRGSSEVTAGGSYGVEAHARDVLELAGQLEARRLHYVGWSMGAVIGMEVAKAAPQLLRSIVLLDHTGPMDAEALEIVRSGLGRLDTVVDSPDQYLAALRGRGLIDPWTPFWSEHYAYELAPREDGRWSPRTSREACQEDLDRFERDWPPLWAGLEMPTTLIRTTGSIGGGQLVPDHARDAFASVLPDAQIVETRTNHWTVLTDPVMLTAVGANLDQADG